MTEVSNNQEAQRYELDADGALAVAEYRLEGERLLITHVEVPERLRGQGIAAKVMEAVVKDAKTRQLTLVPICSYAAAYLKRQGA